MKRVLSVQDLSCVGKCSLTVALPVLSAMGCACSALPTAVLSTHTAFDNPHRHMLTEDIAPICRHWQSAGVSFDAVTVGYLADPKQAEQVSVLLDSLDTFTVIDPVLGDHGRLYSGITDDHIAAIKDLCRQADVLLPNLTEAAFLTGSPYEQTCNRGYLDILAEKLLCLGADRVILTGVSLDAERTGFLALDKNADPYIYQTPKIPRQLHGTGDMFCAVFTGALMAGKPFTDAAVLAAKFVEQVICATPEASPFGAEFESRLPWLWEQL